MDRVPIKASTLIEFLKILGKEVFDETFEKNGAILDVIDDFSGIKVSEITIKKVVFKKGTTIIRHIPNGTFQWMYWSKDQTEDPSDSFESACGGKITSADVGRRPFTTKEEAISDVKKYVKENNLPIPNIISE